MKGLLETKGEGRNWKPETKPQKRENVKTKLNVSNRETCFKVAFEDNFFVFVFFLRVEMCREKKQTWSGIDHTASNQFGPNKINTQWFDCFFEHLC